MKIRNPVTIIKNRLKADKKSHRPFTGYGGHFAKWHPTEEAIARQAFDRADLHQAEAAGGADEYAKAVENRIAKEKDDINALADAEEKLGREDNQRNNADRINTEREVLASERHFLLEHLACLNHSHGKNGTKHASLNGDHLPTRSEVAEALRFKRKVHRANEQDGHEPKRYLHKKHDQETESKDKPDRDR